MRFGMQCVALAVAATLTAGAQMHRVAKKDNVTRAVGVWEWTGDPQKPAASRLIPVSLFVDGDFQDAGLYMARPVPLALNSDVVYELQDAGQPKGLVDLDFARNLQPSDASASVWDQGWTGYGKWQPLPVIKEKKPAKVTLESTDKKDDDERPTFGKKGGKDKKDEKKNKKAPEDHGSVTPVDSDPSDDSDRPTLKKRSTQEKREAIKNAVSGVGDLNDDPDRPKIARGKPANQPEAPPLTGAPITMQQMVAVSDATTRDPHDFNYRWRDPAEKSEILTKLEKVAQSLIAPTTPAPTVVKPKPGVSRSTGARSKMRVGVTPDTTPAPFKLEDEKFSAYELSYNSAPVFVLEGRTNGVGSPSKHVTIVAQNDTFGEPQVAIKTVTDDAHLGVTPWMRLVGAVDADASNRASLLMELRGDGSRSFALYRVISAQATQIFSSGSTR